MTSTIHFHVVQEESYDEEGCFTRTTKWRPLHEAEARHLERSLLIQRQAAAFRVLAQAQAALEQRRIASGKAPKYIDENEDD